MEPAISIKGLTKSYGDVRALHNFSMEVREGEFFGFVFTLAAFLFGVNVWLFRRGYKIKT